MIKKEIQKTIVKKLAETVSLKEKNEKNSNLYNGYLGQQNVLFLILEKCFDLSSLTIIGLVDRELGREKKQA